MIVRIVIAVVLSLAVAPVLQAQTAAERAAAERVAEYKARVRAEHRAESEAAVRFTLSVNGERHRLQLIEAYMCESYRVRAKAIERSEREFPSARAQIDLEEFPHMTASWHKEREASCRESVQRTQDQRESAKREISEYQSGEEPRCCGVYQLGSLWRAQEVFLLHLRATMLCQEGRQQLHVKAGVESLLANPLLVGIGLLDQKAGNLAQDVVDTACPLLEKYESWARDVDPDNAAEYFASRPGDP